MFTVSDMMTNRPYTLLGSNTLQDARTLMETHNIRHIPIVDLNQTLIGLVSQRDLLAAQSSCLEKTLSKNLFTLNSPLSHIMCENVMSISPHGELKSAALFMQKHKIGCLPVISCGKLVGIITDSDFVAIAINLLELQEEAEPLEFG